MKQCLNFSLLDDNMLYYTKTKKKKKNDIKEFKKRTGLSSNQYIIIS